MKALVTGATGFSGSWLCKALSKQGWTVQGWSKRPPQTTDTQVSHRTVDITNFQAVTEGLVSFKPDVVFHLAAISNVAQCERDPGLAHAVNCAASVHLFRSMPDACRGVFVSSCHVYGTPLQLPITEHHAASPQNAYAHSKLEAEIQILSSKRDVMIARSFHHTGPGQTTSFVIADWASQIKKKPPRLEVGNVAVTRDFTDVRDVVQAYLLLAEKGHSGDIYNICSGEERSLESIALQLIGGRPIELKVRDARLRKQDTPRIVGDASKIRALGWSPAIPLERTLADMLTEP